METYSILLAITGILTIVSGVIVRGVDKTLAKEEKITVGLVTVGAIMLLISILSIVLF